MKNQNHKFNNKAQANHQRDAFPWRYGAMALVCGLLLIGGFFWAAKQHFSVIDLAIKNAKLRREKEVLESEQRRLYLAREIALSPAEIKKAAHKIGLQDLTPENIEIMMPEKPQGNYPQEQTTAFLKQTSTPIPIVEPENNTQENQPVNTEIRNTIKKEPVEKKTELTKTEVKKTAEKIETAKKNTIEKTDKKTADKSEKADSAKKKTEEKADGKKSDDKKVDKKADSTKTKSTTASASNKKPQTTTKKQ